jgi:hypothetical protein
VATDDDTAQLDERLQSLGGVIQARPDGQRGARAKDVRAAVAQVARAERAKANADLERAAAEQACRQAPAAASSRGQNNLARALALSRAHHARTVQHSASSAEDEARTKSDTEAEMHALCVDKYFNQKLQLVNKLRQQKKLKALGKKSAALLRKQCEMHVSEEDEGAGLPDRWWEAFADASVHPDSSAADDEAAPAARTEAEQAAAAAAAAETKRQADEEAAAAPAPAPASASKAPAPAVVPPAAPAGSAEVSAVTRVLEARPLAVPPSAPALGIGQKSCEPGARDEEPQQALSLASQRALVMGVCVDDGDCGFDAAGQSSSVAQARQVQTDPPQKAAAPAPSPPPSQKDAFRAQLQELRSPIVHAFSKQAAAAAAAPAAAAPKSKPTVAAASAPHTPAAAAPQSQLATANNVPAKTSDSDASDGDAGADDRLSPAIEHPLGVEPSRAAAGTPAHVCSKARPLCAADGRPQQSTGRREANPRANDLHQRDPDYSSESSGNSSDEGGSEDGGSEDGGSEDGGSEEGGSEDGGSEHGDGDASRSDASAGVATATHAADSTVAAGADQQSVSAGSSGSGSSGSGNDGSNEPQEAKSACGTAAVITPPAAAAKKKAQSGAEETCEMCGESQWTAINPMVLCEVKGCSLGRHRRCFPADRVPDPTEIPDMKHRCGPHEAADASHRRSPRVAGAAAAGAAVASAGQQSMPLHNLPPLHQQLPDSAAGASGSESAVKQIYVPGSLWKAGLAHNCQQLSVEMRPSTLPNGGRGLFATRAVKKNDLVGWMWGKFMRASEWHRLVNLETNLNATVVVFEKLKEAEEEEDYVTEAQSGVWHCIDPLGVSDAQHEYLLLVSRQCPLGLANDSRTSGGKHARNIAIDWQARGADKGGLSPVMDWRMLPVRATRNVASGEELFVDYGWSDKMWSENAACVKHWLSRSALGAKAAAALGRTRTDLYKHPLWRAAGDGHCLYHCLQYATDAFTLDQVHGLLKRTVHSLTWDMLVIARVVPSIDEPVNAAARKEHIDKYLNDKYTLNAIWGGEREIELLVHQLNYKYRVTVINASDEKHPAVSVFPSAAWRARKKAVIPHPQFDIVLLLSGTQKTPENPDGWGHFDIVLDADGDEGDGPSPLRAVPQGVPYEADAFLAEMLQLAETFGRRIKPAPDPQQPGNSLALPFDVEVSEGRCLARSGCSDYFDADYALCGCADVLERGRASGRGDAGRRPACQQQQQRRGSGSRCRSRCGRYHRPSRRRRAACCCTRGYGCQQQLGELGEQRRRCGATAAEQRIGRGRLEHRWSPAAAIGGGSGGVG